jgi:RNA polymerase sigma factor (sigma-70 family)
VSRRVPSEEVKLIRTAAACDDQATVKLFRRFAGAIRHAIGRFASRPEDREDLHSEVVIRLLADDKRALRNWEPRAPFAAYASSVAAHHCIDWIRSEGKLPPTQVDPAALGHGSMIELLQATHPAPLDEEPEQVLTQSERRTMVAEGLAELSADDRLVLFLRYEQGMNGVEVAQALGLSHGAARQRIFRALRRLEQILEDEPAVFEDVAGSES